jgi:hypothetical protein
MVVYSTQLKVPDADPVERRECVTLCLNVVRVKLYRSTRRSVWSPVEVNPPPELTEVGGQVTVSFVNENGNPVNVNWLSGYSNGICWRTD